MPSPRLPLKRYVVANPALNEVLTVGFFRDDGGGLGFQAAMDAYTVPKDQIDQNDSIPRHLLAVRDDGQGRAEAYGLQPKPKPGPYVQVIPDEITELNDVAAKIEGGTATQAEKDSALVSMAKYLNENWRIMDRLNRRHP